MAAFGTDGRCLMRALQEELDGTEIADCGRCSVCTGPRFAQPPDPALVELAQRHLRSRPIELEVKKMAPDAAGAMRKIPDDARIEPGLRARARRRRRLVAGDRARPARGHRRRRARRPAWPTRCAAPACAPAWVAAVPSAALGDLLDRSRRRWPPSSAARRSPLVARTGKRPPQREMANAVQQAANVRGAFAVAQAPPPGSAGVLLDDRRSSGWTLAMVGGQLRRAGAGAVVPVALATIS